MSLKEYIKTKVFKRTCLIIALLVIGIPLGINALYKSDKVFITTVWTGADVLAYYGTILGTIATIVALICTIWFTRRQITFEQYLRSETEKWGRIEKLFVAAISLAQPKTLSSIYMDSITRQSVEGCAELMRHMYELQSAIDSIYGVVEEKDEPKVHELLQSIENKKKKKEKLSDQYSTLLMALNSFRGSTDENVKNMQTLILMNQQKEISDAVTELNKNEYRTVLQMKKGCFGAIYKEIEKNASSLLYMKTFEEQ